MALHLHIRVLGWVNRFYLRTTVHNVSFKSEVEGCLSVFMENMHFPSLLGRNGQKRWKAGCWALALLRKGGFNLLSCEKGGSEAQILHTSPCCLFSGKRRWCNRWALEKRFAKWAESYLWETGEGQSQRWTCNHTQLCGLLTTTKRPSYFISMVSFMNNGDDNRICYCRVLFRLNKLRKRIVNPGSYEYFHECSRAFFRGSGVVFPCLPTHQAAHLREVLVSAGSFSKGHRKWNINWGLISSTQE